MPQYKVMIATFPGGNVLHPDVCKYVSRLMLALQADPSVGPGNFGEWGISGTPVTTLRNKALVMAEESGYDFVLMIDNDMAPDLPYDDAKEFFQVAWPFAKNHHGPCIVAAPYCNGPPEERIWVFDWQNKETGDTRPNFKPESVNRHDAAGRKGIERVAAIGTGLMLIDVRGVKKMAHPRFDYEYTDEKKTSVASTEDVYFCRNADAAGIPVYCAWDSWAGHHKSKMVLRPERIPHGTIPVALMARARELVIEEMRAAVKKKAEAKLVLPKTTYDYPAMPLATIAPEIGVIDTPISHPKRPVFGVQVPVQSWKPNGHRGDMVGVGTNGDTADAALLSNGDDLKE